MNGRPVWLASVSHRDSLGRIVPTGRWSERRREKADRVIERLLDGVGDPGREVAFRMNITVCRHRGLTNEEEVGLRRSFHEFKATDTAGASVELLWARGVTGAAIQPCANPRRKPIGDSGDPDLWLPIPCEQCESCRARQEAAA
jgi:hypothetical protein